jgi:hypothetical protein
MFIFGPWSLELEPFAGPIVKPIKRTYLTTIRKGADPAIILDHYTGRFAL